MEADELEQVRECCDSREVCDAVGARPVARGAVGARRAVDRSDAIRREQTI